MNATRYLHLAWASLTVLVSAPVLADFPEYRVIQPPWEGDSYGVIAVDINNAGQVAGWASGMRLGWIWSGSDLTIVSAPGLEASLAAIDSAGQGVGAFRIAAPFEQNHAFLWNGSSMIRLIEPPGTLRSSGRAINDNGQIVVEALTYGNTRSFVLKGSSITDIGTLGGDTRTYDMNNAGHVVGWSNATANSPSRAVVWDGNALTDLASLIPSTLPNAESIAHAINDSNQIVGWAQTGPYGQALLWEGSAVTNLGTLGGDGATAFDINSLGQVVGSAQTQGTFGDWHGFLWDRAQGGMVDLNDYLESPEGWSIHRALKINDAGQILATGTNLVTGEYRSDLLLTPVPEPATAALWIAGLALVAARSAQLRHRRSGGT